MLIPQLCVAIIQAMITFNCYAIFIHYFFAENYRACLVYYPCIINVIMYNDTIRTNRMFPITVSHHLLHIYIFLSYYLSCHILAIPRKAIVVCVDPIGQYWLLVAHTAAGVT